VKLLNASKFALAFPAVDEGVATEPLDRALLARLAEVVGEAGEAFEAYDYARALERTEAFFWTFCDDYIELVKGRAYGEGPQAQSAGRTLRLALDVLLRLFAPVLPFATEEVWSWWHEDSVHHQSWPTVAELQAAGAGDDAAVLPLAAAVLAEVRKAKSTAKLSMRAEVSRVLVVRPDDALRLLEGVRTDLANAGVVAELLLEAGDQPRVEVELAPAP
jgi:valyl-tRNA synthetase